METVKNEELKLLLKAVEIDGQIGFETQFHKIGTEHVVQAIMYLLDTAFAGNVDNVNTIVNMLPEVSDKYFEIKEDVLNDRSRKQEETTNRKQ